MDLPLQVLGLTWSRLEEQVSQPALEALEMGPGVASEGVGGPKSTPHPQRRLVSLGRCQACPRLGHPVGYSPQDSETHLGPV